MGELTLIGAMRGRPSSYTEEMAERICERIAGGETLLKICEDVEMPSRRTVSLWVLKHPDFHAQYALARAMQADHEFDEIKQIADDAGKEVDERRVMIDSRKWRAERLNPRAYGSKVVHQHHVEDNSKLDREELPGGLTFLGQHKTEKGE